MRNKARVVLRTTADERAPGTVTAIIDDAQNIGASTYYNSPGEFHMTLPLLHPQAGKCEPWRTHYVVEENMNGLWVQRFAGILSDFDANENDIVVYGIDYIGLLSRVIDTRYVQGSPELPPPTGSKYISQTISAIISDLLTYAKAKTNTPVRFIPVGPIDTFPEVVTIYSTFVGITEMIFGLVDSHRQGTGKRSRFWCEHLGGIYHQWRVSDNPGVDRPNLRMEYGGLVQGFQAIGFGDWAIKAHGIGRTQTGYELFYQSATAPGVDYTSATGYPAIETADVYDNVADLNDLQRRVKQKAMTASRIGKRIALGLRSEILSPFDGYDIADSVPIAIKRGAIDTTRWGSGYWSIYGVEWRVKQDGSTETTLVVSPKEVAQAINADTLTDNEALPAPIETVRIADGAIDPSKLADGAVTTPKLADLAVASGKVADDAIGTGQIQPLAVTNTELGLGAVATPNFDPAAKAPLAGLADTADLAIEVENSTAEVIIDASGLTILNGKLFLTDYGGASVLGPAGFDGSWVEFIHNGVYNGGFNAGITTWTIPGVSGTGDSVAAITIVSSADSPDDYLASLSAAVPYWIISDYSSTDSSISATILADAVDGRSLWVERAAGAATDGGYITLMQDVPVVQGREYEVDLNFAFSVGGVDAGGASELILARGWRDSEHGSLVADAVIETHSMNPALSADPSGLRTASIGTAPVGAKYARLFIKMLHPSTATVYGRAWQLFDVRLKVVPSAGKILMPGFISGETVYPQITTDGAGSVEIRASDTPAGWAPVDFHNLGDDHPHARIVRASNGGALILGSGSDATMDITLARGAANRLDLASGDGFRIGNKTNWGVWSGAFPTVGIATGDLCFREDWGLEMFWNGSHWLSTQMFFYRSDTYSFSASGVVGFEQMLPFSGWNTTYAERFFVHFYITGGTALSGAHSWTFQLNYTPADAAIGGLVINSGAINAWRTSSATSAISIPTTSPTSYLIVTKTGTPGNIQMQYGFTYRVRG